jgi:hypothetical protein
MLPNSITLAVDEENNSSPTDHVLTRAEEGANKSVYYDADHTIASRNECAFIRTFPKQNGNFYGTLRTSVKFTEDVEVLGVNGENIKVPLIAEAVFSFPVGTDNATATLARQKLVAMLDYDTVMDPFHDQGQI